VTRIFRYASRDLLKAKKHDPAFLGGDPAGVERRPRGEALLGHSSHANAVRKRRTRGWDPNALRGRRSTRLGVYDAIVRTVGADSAFGTVVEPTVRGSSGVAQRRHARLRLRCLAQGHGIRGRIAAVIRVVSGRATPVTVARPRAWAVEGSTPWHHAVRLSTGSALVDRSPSTP
jgi:hypothetical protein